MRLPTFARRDALKLLAAASLSWPALAQAQQPGGQPPAAPASPQPQSRFVYDDVVRRARDLAALPYEAPRNDLPASLTGMNFDQYRDLRFRPDRSLLQQGGGPFRMQMFHLGFIYRTPVVVNVIREGIATPIPYAAALFDYGRNRFERPLPVDLGFAGFRIHHPLNDPRVHDELISFLGASYFRFLGRGQKYGLSARGIAVNTAGPGQEEFPVFREFWVETPSAEAQSCQIYALLDGESLTGAFRFTVFPAQETVLDVHCTLFPRRAIPKLGVAPLTSMFFYAENDRRFFDDYRPELHDSDGLLIHSDTGEWLWRPLRNPRQVEVSQFADRQVRGFGLMQRDRIFEHYQDLDLNYELRPSYWVEPREGFADGRVELVEIPTTDETNDNIVAYWVPNRAVDQGQTLTFAYRVVSTMTEGRLHPGGFALNTFRTKPIALGSGEQAPSNATRFIVDFVGGDLEYHLNHPDTVQVVPSATNARITRTFLIPNPQTRGFRAGIDVVGEAGQTADLRAFLRTGTKALTETWTFPWKVE
ncbi:glucan biosynthesis protein [Phreatobacter oligotrophus]|jgi:periplasmic glucans biosynthesis protein|uniref:Glucans biosynthesis protein G n=1 Tax=Phreatobacter oligotrophus TaxID=1122261 RepID=A0A2T4Z358_9HYPH|nr:glucan biosynthesis protein G [Phreatobacter oligotrophus]PTM55214.1 glucans biosynthesis protein [Phreatobacter oligotrophus]